jgi:DNA-binding GntR family transcriptional regulator
VVWFFWNIGYYIDVITQRELVEASGQIKRQKTLTEQAADAIRARIVSGEFHFGEALSEIALATELGVSKTPVREAFLQLKNEGLVEILPQRGTFVFQMTGEQLRQLVEMRELLEGASLRFAMRNGAPLADALQIVIDRMAAAVDEHDHAAYRRHDADFHQAIISASGNAFIDSAYSIIAFRVQALRNRLSLEAQNWRSFEGYKDVARHVRDNNVDAAQAKLLEYIGDAVNAYMARIQGDLAQTG